MCGLFAVGVQLAAGCSSPYTEGASEPLPVRDAKDATPAEASTDAGASGGPSLRTEWVKTFGVGDGTPDSGPYVRFRDVAVNSGGASYVTGDFSDVDLPIGSEVLRSGGGPDALLFRLDGAGNPSDAVKLGEANEQYGFAVATTEQLTYVSVLLKGAVRLGGDTVTNTGTGYTSVVSRFAPAYAQSRPAAGSNDVFIKRLAPDLAGGVLAFGDFTPNVTVVGTTFTTSGTGLVLARMFGTGGESARALYGADGGAALGNSLASSASGGILLTGRFVGDLPLGAAGTLSTKQPHAFVIRVGQDLAPTGARDIGGSGVAEGIAVAAIPSGAGFIVAGTFAGTLALPGQAAITTAGGPDIFVIRFDDAGNVVWVRTFGGASDDVVSGVAVDDDDNVFVAGSYASPSIDFGGGPLVNSDLGANGSHDVFLTHLGGDGRHLYSARFGDAGDQIATAVGVDAKRGVLVVGYFTGAIDFGTGAQEAKGRTDAFAAKLTY